MGWWYRRGWWCPRHPWPPAWARGWWWYPADPSEELKALESLRRDLEAELSDLSKRIEELKRTAQGKG
jgi:hypothetical protein